MNAFIKINMTGRKKIMEEYRYNNINSHSFFVVSFTQSERYLFLVTIYNDFKM